MKRFIITLILFLNITILISPLSAEKTPIKPGKFSSCPQSAKKAVEAIEKLPEASAMIDEAQKEGAIRIEYLYQDSLDFEAYWDSGKRTIFINGNRNKDLGEIICSILFELHNATTNKTIYTLLKKAQIGEITKDQYVENIERMEHQNAVNTVRLIEKGIASGLFPPTSRWNIYENFDDHYMIQQLYGHSQFIAANFDKVNPRLSHQPYKGTIKNLDNLAQFEKDELVRYLSIKNKVNSNMPHIKDEGIALLKKEFETLAKCEVSNDNKDPVCKNFKEKINLLEMVFQPKSN